MRVYFASLSDYNNGRLHGVWVDLEGLDETEIQDEINAMLRTSRYPNVVHKCSECNGGGTSCGVCGVCGGKGEYHGAEEWAIHEYENMQDMGENPSLSDLVEYARLKDEHGDAWDAYVECVGKQYATEDDFQEKYAGEADSERDWVEQWIDDSGMLEGVSDSLTRYFDYDAYLRDMRMGGELSFERINGTVYAFWN